MIFVGHKLRALGIALAAHSVVVGFSTPLPGQEAESVADQVALDPKPFDELEATNEFVMFDGFDGKFLLNWQPVRLHASHVSLTKNRGKLTITIQHGTIHAGEVPSAKNIFLIANPLGPKTDFVMTTCLTEFNPQVPYEQAGLICYDDDDNYLKWDYEFNGQPTSLCVLTEMEGQAQFQRIGGPIAGKNLWLRLTKRGSAYEYASSTDGTQYTVHGESTWGNGAPKRIGLVAKAGKPGAPEIDAQFEYFELRTVVPQRVTGTSGEK